MTRRHQPFSQDVAIAALAGQVDELRLALDAEKTLLAQVRRDVTLHGRALDELAQLARRSTQAATPTASTPASTTVDGEEAPDWMAVSDPGLAIAWVSDLSVWVPRIWARYPGGTIPGCWAWHPPVTAELLVTRHQWAEATLPGQGAAALGAWHDRWRPNAAARIVRSMAGCDRAAGCHVNAAGNHFTYDPARLDELGHWWATTDRADLDAAPGLTREERHGAAGLRSASAGGRR